MKSYSLFAWSTGLTLLVYLGGCIYALATKQIDFAIFTGAVGTVLGAMTGWAAKSAQVTQP